GERTGASIRTAEPGQPLVSRRLERDAAWPPFWQCDTEFVEARCEQCERGALVSALACLAEQVAQGGQGNAVRRRFGQRTPFVVRTRATGGQRRGARRPR